MPGWQNLIVCGTQDTHACGFSDLVLLAQNLIADLVLLSTIVAVALFVFIGFNLIRSQGNPTAMTAAKKSATSLVIGYVVILAAWLVVNTISNVLLNNNYSLLGPIK